MINVIPYTEDKKSLWNNFNKNAKNGIFMFDRNYMDYHSDRFRDNSLMFYNGDELVALLPLNKKENRLISHEGLTFGGFITNSKMKPQIMLECFESLRGYMLTNGCSTLLYKVLPHIYHTLPAEDDLYALFRNKAFIYKVEPSNTINLQEPIKISRGRKPHISRAKREGVEIAYSEDFETFIDLVNLVLSKRHGAIAVHTANELRLLKSRFPNEINLWTAMYQGKMIAATLLFEYKNVVHTQYLASNDLSCEIGGLDLLLSTLIEKFKDKKKYFDFGISSENNGLYLNEGLFNQKATFGGKCTCHLTYSLEFSNVK